jgi:hypothetical protein|nr:hypothetical protein [Hallella colorans]
MSQNNSSDTIYTKLEQIQLRKAMIQKEIQKDDHKIKGHWNSLFAKSRQITKSTSPTKRFGGLMTTGAGLFDAIILGWKLYRKFKK